MAVNGKIGFWGPVMRNGLRFLRYIARSWYLVMRLICSRS